MEKALTLEKYTDWKSAFIVPLFKKENQNKASNYHPTSLTSIVCKSLLLSINHLAKWLDDDQQVDTILILLDFSKVFDKVLYKQSAAFFNQ